MNSNDTADRPSETNRDGHLPADVPPPPARKPAAPIPAPLLGEPQVVLKDPPAIFGGGSHTW